MTQPTNPEVSRQSASAAETNHAGRQAQPELDLPIPANGESVSVMIQPGAHLKFPIDLNAATLEARGADLLIKLEGGGVLTLTDFITHSEGDRPPMLALGDDTLLPGQSLLAAIEGEAIETAAGDENPAGSGIGAYGDDAGDLIQGVARMDGLDFKSSDPFRAPDLDDLGLAGGDRLERTPLDGGDPVPDGTSGDGIDPVGNDDSGADLDGASGGEDSAGSGTVSGSGTVGDDGGTAPDTVAPSVTLDDFPPTGDSTPTLSGTAEPGSTVIIEVGGQTLATSSDADGNWQVTIPDGTPLADGAFTVVATATDAAGNMATASGTLSIDTQAPAIVAVEVSPTGDRISGTTEADAEVTLTLPDGETVSVTADGEGHFEFQFDAPYTAGESFQLVASDDVGNLSEALPLAAPTAPNAGEVQFTTAEDTAIEITAADLLAQSSDPDSDSLTIENLSLADPAAGSLTDNGDGTWTYTPAPDFNAEAVTLNFTVSDGALSDTSVATIAVTPVNDAPQVGDTIPTQQAVEDAAYEFTIPADTFTDVDGDALSLSVDDLPAGLSFDPASGTISGTPTVPGSYSVTVTADDGQGGSVSETFTIDVANTNDAPVAGDDGGEGLHTAEDTPLTGIDVLANDSDVDGDDLSVTQAEAEHGSVTVEADGTLTYTPDADFNGSDTITYTVSDGNGGQDTASVTLTVDPVNDAPQVGDTIPTQQAVEDAAYEFTIPADTFTDVDGDALSLSVDDLPAGLSFDPASGTISGTPTVPGSYSVTVTADDGQGGSVSETFTIDVANTNDAPVAGDDGGEGLHTAEDTPLTGIDVLANDSDVDGDDLSVTQAEVEHGSVTVEADGTLTYTPDADYNGDDTITYTVSDGNGGQDTASVTLTVDGVNDAHDDAVSAHPHQTVMIDVLANDTAAEMTLTSVELADSTQGTVAIVDNQVAFTPADGVENTTVTLSYAFTDGQGNLNGADVSVTLGDYASAYDLASAGDLTSSIDLSAVSVDSGTHTIEADLYPNSDLSFTISAQIPEVAPTLDLYMVQDMTGSFIYDDMPTVRGEVSTSGDASDLGLLDDIVSAVTERYADAQFGIGSFNDTPNSGDHQQFQHDLDLAAGEGGHRLDEAYDPDAEDPFGLGNGYYGADIPESQAFALQQVALMAQNNENGFREDAAKVAVLITDATSHGDAAEIEAMATALNDAGMRVIFLVADNGYGLEHNMDFYQSWIDDYGVNGTVVPLASDSSNLVEALTTGIDNLQESLSLEISGDAFGLASIGEGVIDGDTITWEVQLEAPLDGSHTGSQVEFVVNDSASSQVGETIQLNVHTEHNLEGTIANDYLQGHSGDNGLVGAEGDDLLEGLGGNDELDGGSGNDILVGGEGDDLLSGGQGDDHLSGGDGSDTYAFSANGGEGNDVIHDFDVNSDVIRLSDVLDVAPDGSTDLEDLLHAGDQQVAVTVTGADVALEISGSQGQTSLTLEGINAGGAFNGDTSLSDLIDSGLIIQQDLG